MSHGVPPLGVSNKGGVGKISSFLSVTVNISKTVADTAKVIMNYITLHYIEIFNVA